MKDLMNQVTEIVHTLFCLEDHGPGGNCDFYTMVNIAGYEEDEFYVEWEATARDVMIECGIKDAEDFLATYKSIAGVMKAFGELNQVKAKRLVSLLIDQSVASSELSPTFEGLPPAECCE